MTRLLHYIKVNRFALMLAIALIVLAQIDQAALASLPFLVMGAVANTKSTVVTNGDTYAGSVAPNMIGRGRLKSQVATVETAAADDAGSLYRLFRVHSSWRIDRLLIANDAITNMSTADIGVYDIADNGGAVVTSMTQHFGSAVDLSSAHALTDYTYEATATDISKIEQPLWQRMGLTSDPNKFYDIAVAATTNDPSAAGTISGILNYVDNA